MKIGFRSSEEQIGSRRRFYSCPEGQQNRGVPFEEVQVSAGQKGRIGKFNRILNREKPPYYFTLGLEILEVSESFAKVKMSFSNDVANVYGFINGGIIVTLADATVANALLTVYDKEILTAIDVKMNFLRPAKSDIYAVAHARHCGKQIAVCDVNVADADGKDIATGLFTYAVRKPRK